MNKFILTILTMIETIKVSSRGQIVIPESVRKRFGIKEGSKLVLRERGQKLILEKEQDFEKEIETLESQQEKTGWLLIAE
ncbi:AbrB/MazE/SpoVT family DNA-binding domain-containing protein, partial [Candidatus Woesearchaeota archaeon]|nr:AbrB/MazE/SpoVT family DNA-binding domain-containing protein [Candidatus Woesearchaeota archaeon]